MANRSSVKSVSPGTHIGGATHQPPPIETAGEIFPGGTSIEPLADAETEQLCLLFTNGRTRNVATRIEYGGRAYIPLNLDARTLRAVRFPQQISDQVSTKALFMAIRQVFIEFGFSEEIALVGTFFVFSTWFPDCVPAAPCLLISGPRPEADLFFFKLLACLVRHPLQLVDFNPNSLFSLMKIQPTLLIVQEHLTDSKLKLLLASNNPHSYIPLRDGLTSFYSAKAIYRGIPFSEDSFGNTMLRIHLTPIRGKLPILDSKTQKGIALKFQSKLVNYRVRNIEKVRASTFDFPWLTSGFRILARILGVCITDDPDLQADLAPFFQRQQRAMREQNWLDKRCVAIEVGLALCHSTQKENLVYVGKFADDANTILKGRWHTELLEPKEMGLILRTLGFSPKRGSKGYAIRLTDKVRRRIHRLAFEFDVAALLDRKPRCPHCHEILKADVTEASPTTERGETPNP